MPKILTKSQIEQFIEEGYVRLEGGFSPETAASCREILWKRIGLNPEDSSTWTKQLIHLAESFSEGAFQEVWTPRIEGAFDDALGEGRYRKLNHYGWWPISFPGFESAPWDVVPGWHVDGIQFHHHINSREQGLLPIFLFSDIVPGDGGTSFYIGSHKITARILAEAEPAGLDVNTLAKLVSDSCDFTDKTKVREGVGAAGDVLMMHPFMLHTRSKNTGSRVRFICNPCVTLNEEMNLARPDGEYTPVEQAIVNAVS